MPNTNSIDQLLADRDMEIEAIEIPVLRLNFIDDFLIQDQVISLEVEVDGLGKVSGDFDALKLQNTIRKRQQILMELLDAIGQN